MGNFSRNTFDRRKNYVAVRLQQGVPLVDADWNELNDVVRHGLYDGLNMAFPDGIVPATYLGGFWDLLIQPTGDNDLIIWGGRVLIRGRPITIGTVRYSTQPWTDPARAAQDGVDVIPPLTTPEADRTDIVYLDVWEREVDSTEDPDLINPAIGIETCVRLKREVAIRVTEGTTTLPSIPDGHFFMLLALLHRPAGEAEIAYERIEDLRPFLYGMRGTREASFLPAFLPLYFFGPLDPWLLMIPWDPKFYAYKPTDKMALGLLPLVLPEGAHVTHLKIRGYTQGAVQFMLLRIRHEYREPFDALLDQTIQPLGGATERTFNKTFSVPCTDRKNIVDNTRYYYGLYAIAEGTDYRAEIHGISIRYQY